MQALFKKMHSFKHNNIDELELHIMECLCGIGHNYLRLMTSKDILYQLINKYGAYEMTSHSFEQTLRRMQKKRKIRLYKEATTFDEEVYGLYDISKVREQENIRKQNTSAVMDRILVHGFVRELEAEYDLFCLVGADVINLLILFTLKLYTAHAKGKQTVGELGLTNNYELEQWTELESFSQYLSGTDLEHIYLGKQRFSLLGVQHNIYSVGSNMNGDCGVSSTRYAIFAWDQITQFAVHNARCHNKLVTFDNIEVTTSKELELEIRMLSNGMSAYHTFICTNDDRLFVYGNLKANQAGTGIEAICSSGDYSIYPVEITFKFAQILKNKEKIAQMECGRYHSLFLSNKGTVYALGKIFGDGANASGIRRDSYDEPRRIIFDAKKEVSIIKIACGFGHCLALTSDHKVYGWGNDIGKGQLGIAPLPKHKTSSDYCAAKYSTNVPILNTNLSNIIFIACGYDDSLCIDENFICYVFGSTAFQTFKHGQNPLSGWSYRSPRGDQIDQYYKPHKFGVEFIKDGCCGFNHTALLTVNNEVIIFKLLLLFSNDTTDNWARVSSGPGFYAKLSNKDIGLSQDQVIEKVVAGYENTIVIAT